jgi:hypothetical protein
VTDNFFDRLEADLGELTRRGTHLETAQGRSSRRLFALVRRSAVVVVLAVVFLAASLAGESPTSAGGHTPAVPLGGQAPRAFATR